MAADAGMRIVQRPAAAARATARFQSIEGAESVQAAERPLTFACQSSPASGTAALSLSPQEHLLRRVALPAVGAVQGGDQPGRVESIQPRDAPRFRANRIDAIDASLVLPGAQVEPLLPVQRNPLGMLDHRAIHVGHPQGPVRPGLDRCGPKPVVAGGQKLGLLLVRRRGGS